MRNKIKFVGDIKMKKNKSKTLPTILILLVTSMIMFSSVQESNALPSEFKDIRDGYKGHLIRVYEPETMTITTSEASHVYHGWTGLTKQDLKDLDPLEVKIFLDGVEIDLDDCKEKVGSGSDKTYNVLFYQTFDTGFFTPGIYNWTVVWSDVTGIVWYQSYPLTVLNEPHRIVVYNTDSMTITTSERSFVKHGWVGITDEEISNLEPLNVQVYLDGEEIELYPIVEETEENTYDVLFYQYFDAHYFALGIYNWTVVWSDVTGIVWYKSHHLIVLNEPHHLKVFDAGSMTIATSERSYIRHGWGWSPEEIEDVSFYENRPFYVQLYIDDQEIDLYQKLEIDYDELGNPTYYRLLFYQNFDAGYFAPGIYNWTVVWSLSSEPYWIQSHPLTVLEDSHRLNLYASTEGVDPESLIITTSERSYIRHGWGWSPEEIEDVSFYENRPFYVQLYIDDQEIDLYQKLEIDYDELGNPTYYRLLFYQNFDAGYFAPGEYDITAIWTDTLGDSFKLSRILTVLEDGHQIIVYRPNTMTIFDSERSYIRHGWVASPEEFGNEEFYNSRPFEVQFEIDGQQIDLYQDFKIDYDEFGEIIAYHIWFYQTFNEYYFLPGTYDWTVKWFEGDGDYLEITETLYVVTDNLPSNLDVSIDYSHGMAVEGHDAGLLGSNLISCGSDLFIIDGTFGIQSETDVLLISASTTSFTTGELDEIYNWFYSSGSKLLWVAGDSDYIGQFNPVYNNEILSTIGSRLRLSAEAVNDPNNNDGMPYRVAVNQPISNGLLNSIFTMGVSSIIMHGPSTVLGFVGGNIVNLAQTSLTGIEIIMMTSSTAVAIDQDNSNTPLDYYFGNGILGNYPMVVIEDLGNQKYVIVSSEAIFSDYKNMYGLTTDMGIWNYGFHDGKVLVDNILIWFGTLIP